MEALEGMFAHLALPGAARRVEGGAIWAVL